MADHPVLDIIEGTEETHRGLGNLAAMTVLCIKARKCMVTVSPPGCGKSTITNWIQEKHPDAYIKDSITRSSLTTYSDQFNGFTGCMLFDDVGKIDTPWSRVQTLVTMAELIHGHFVSKDAYQIKIDIDDFHGSAVLNIQPSVLAEVMEHPTWHSNLADKSIRYYHLVRATMPTRDGLDVPIDWGLDMTEVEPYNGAPELWHELLEIGLEQWTRPRAIEHCQDLLAAVAAIGRSPAPGDQEATILLDLMRPLTVELEVMQMHGFGSKAVLDVNLLYLLTEFATYRNVTYETIAVDMHMRPRQVAAILGNMIDWYEKIGTNPIKLQPTARLTQLLEKAGLR